MLKRLSFFRLLLLTAALLLLISHFKKDDLTKVPKLLPSMQQVPLQEETDREPFTFEYRGKRYDVKPVAEYELYGLVISHNNIHSFIDIYHDDDSVDIKDLCVIWGENAANDDYKKLEFWSEPWTCWVRWGPEGKGSFDMEQLSNNHLLSDKPLTRKKIREMKIGDQVYLKGMLVNYREKGSAFTRKSSTVRSDQGNGACEVMFVEQAMILKPGPPFWRKVNRFSKISLILLCAYGIVSFLWSAYRPMLK